MGLAMAAIYKLDILRQTRGRPAYETRAPVTISGTTCPAGGEAAVGDTVGGDTVAGSTGAGSTVVDRGSAMVLLFTGVRYERLPGAPPPQPQRDILEIVD